MFKKNPFLYTILFYAIKYLHCVLSYFIVAIECENLIRKMLVVDPKRRTSISHIKRHHWVESMQAREDLILRFHNVAINDLKHPQTSEIYDERILAVMENAGIDRQKTIEVYYVDVLYLTWCDNGIYQYTMISI